MYRSSNAMQQPTFARKTTKAMRGVLWAGLILLLTGVGCTAIERETERRTPSASIESARIAGFDFDTAQLLVDLRVDNPNPVAVRVAGFDYELRLNGQRALAGDSAERAEIPARGNGNVTVPITLTYRDLARRVADLRDRDTIDYAIDLGIIVDVPLLGERRLPASASGTLPVPQRPGITVNDLRVEQLNLRGARLALDVTVSNPNTFELALGALRYQLNINGHEWTTGALDRLPRIDAGESRTLSIPVDLDFAAIGSGVRQMLISGSRADYDLNGQLTGTAGEELLGDFELSFEESGTAGIAR